MSQPLKRTSVLILLTLLVWSGYGCANPDLFECRNTIVGSELSPDRLYHAVMFERDCGATTKASFHLSILAPGEELEDNDGGNVLIVEDGQKGSGVRVQWISNTILLISYPAGLRIFRAVDRIGTMTIIYRNTAGHDGQALR